MCTGCKGTITVKKQCDECIQKLARNMAKETGESVGLFRDGEGRLRISGADDPVQSYITPHLQGS